MVVSYIHLYFQENVRTPPRRKLYFAKSPPPLIESTVVPECALFESAGVLICLSCEFRVIERINPEGYHRDKIRCIR